MPDLVVIAGCNGAGKSTAAPELLQGAVHVNNFVNADVIANGLSAFEPEKVAFEAGRIMLDRIHWLAKEKTTFAFETTLASRSFAPWIKEIKGLGYQFHLIFLWLRDEELAVSRVQTRIEMGGHAVPETTIRRRYHAGLKNFFELYQPIANSWMFYDNSDANHSQLVASEIRGNKTHIERPELWRQLERKYHD